MGNQQLLILSLTLLIVTILVFVGISIYETSMRQRHVDLLVHQTVTVASEAVVWRQKASPFLGGSNSYEGLAKEGLSKLRLDTHRLPGRVGILRATKDTLEIVAISNDYPEIGILTRVEHETIKETIISYDGSIKLP